MLNITKNKAFIKYLKLDSVLIINFYRELEDPMIRTVENMGM